MFFAAGSCDVVQLAVAVVQGRRQLAVGLWSVASGRGARIDVPQWLAAGDQHH